MEESGLSVDTLEKVGNIKFEFVGDTELLDVHIFRADSYNGEPTESEGKPYFREHHVGLVTTSGSHEWHLWACCNCQKQVFNLLFSCFAEMKPQWFECHQIPFNQMWPDDVMWFPLMLQKKKFIGYFIFQGHDVILRHTLEEVEELWDKTFQMLCILNTVHCYISFEVITKKVRSANYAFSSFIFQH